MLKPFRRHSKDCQYASKGRSHSRCRCPIWVDGSLHGTARVLQALGTRNWEDAQRQCRDLELQEMGVIEADEPPVMLIMDACEKFMVNARSRKLAEPTQKKYRFLFKQLHAFDEEKGLRFVHELDDLDLLDEFRAGWRDEAISALKKL